MSEHLVEQPIVWVDSDEQLEQVCELWRDKTLLAVDTEFMRSQTYYPIAGLIQVNDGEKSYLIDPVAITDYFPLIEIFDDEGITKAIHSCSEDLEVFHYTLGCVPKNILDTQIVAAMTGFGFSVGFGNLVREVLAINLPKGETRSNWLLRPLSKAQVHYAAIDVEYLFVLAQKFMVTLENLSRMQWAEDECRQLAKHYYENQDANNSHARIKTAWKLNARQLAVVQLLCRWREDMAQDKNVPRNRIMKEHAIMSIALLNPTHIAQLRPIEGFTDRMLRTNGEAILALVAKANDLAEDELPEPVARPLGSEDREVLAALKNKVEQVAAELDLPTEILVRKKDYESIVNSLKKGELLMPKTLTGWRKPLVGDALAEIATHTIRG
jgi:ribonuclease D